MKCGKVRLSLTFPRFYKENIMTQSKRNEALRTDRQPSERLHSPTAGAKPYTRMGALNDGERNFAEEHLALVYSFLKKRRLPEDTFYDVVIFGYLSAVKRYLNDEKLHRWKFTTIAWQAMRRSVGRYWTARKRKCRNATVCSLNSPDQKQQNFTLSEVIPDRSVNVEQTVEDKIIVADMLSRLTRRQRRLLSMRANGWSNRYIAGKLHRPIEEMERRRCEIVQLFTDPLDAA